MSIPGEYYKVVLDTDPEYKAIGFIMNNAKGYGKLKSYAVSVDDIETITGIDFFPSLPDGIEEEIENDAANTTIDITQRRIPTSTTAVLPIISSPPPRIKQTHQTNHSAAPRHQQKPAQFSAPQRCSRASVPLLTLLPRRSAGAWLLL